MQKKNKTRYMARRTGNFIIAQFAAWQAAHVAAQRRGQQSRKPASPAMNSIFARGPRCAFLARLDVQLAAQLAALNGSLHIWLVSQWF